MRKIRSMKGVDRVVADQCQLGATAENGGPIRKPTGFLTNSVQVQRELDVRCGGQGGYCSRPGGGKHVLCSGRVARLAAIYPFELCRAILRGMSRQLRMDGILHNDCVGMQMFIEDRTETIDVLNIGYQGGAVEYRDDLTGQPVSAELVLAAVKKELDYFESK